MNNTYKTNKTDWRRLGRSILFVALLLGASLPAGAQDFYVIKAGNNFLAHNTALNGGIANATTFSATTCLWTISGSNIIAISPDGTTGYYLSYRSGNNYALSLRNDGNYIDWSSGISNGGEPLYSTGGWWSTNYYLRFYNNAWGVEDRATHGVLTKLTFSDAPNTSSSSSTSYSASLSGDDVIYSTSGSHTYTATVNQVITYAQTNRTFSGYANSGTTNATINKPYPVSSAYSGALTNVNWSVSPTTYCTINASTGELTINSLPTLVDNITITYTAQAGGQSVTASMTVMLAKDAATVEGVVGNSTGISSSTVTLNDYEDHSWAYYSDAACPVHRLNPVNVKIIYYGYGTKTMTSSNTDQLPANSAFDQNVASTAVQVNKGEAGNKFVYYKTLENANDAGTGNYPYTMIPNPFQMRPTYNNDWRGFYAWRVKSLSSGLSIKVGNTTYTSSNVSSGIIIYAEQEVEFITANEYGDSVAFEALWAKAYLDDGTNHYSNSGNYRNAYERNFKKVTSLTTYDYPVTISSINPDGSGTVGSVSRTSNYTCSNDVKLENMTLSMGNYYINGNSYNLAIGRGVANDNNNVASAVYGDASPNSVRGDFTLRIESGKYSSAYLFYYSSGTGNNDNFTANAIYGSDYDRANNEDNTKLDISGVAQVGRNVYCSNANSIIDVHVLSGKFGSNTEDVELYMGFAGSVNGNSFATRYLEVLGGECRGGIAGGIEQGVNATTTIVNMRIKGGIIHRYLYGSGQYSAGYGSRRIVITGGTFDSWVAGGCFGTGNTDERPGTTNGNIYLYFGGDANQTNTDGIFGAGYGNYNYSNGRYNIQKSNVVFADDATTTGSVYGGGNNGYATDDIKVYLAGGHVAGNVFGGANKAPSSQAVAVVVTGGSVDGGVYGGSNQSGAISGQITVDIYGTDPAPSANAYAINQVFGGGNVAAYTGTPVVTVHNDSSCNISIGEVYGGGLGTTATVTGTNVTIEAGNIIGDVYGGGRQAAVGNGGTSVTVNGGTIRRVFGGNNISGAIADGTAGKITVNVNKTSSCPMKIGQVFGGGNQAGSQVGRITVGCTGDLVTPLADGERYGYDQEGIGAVYGGANEANITGDITLNIVSGIVDSVFGGNNAGGNINGDITVNINKNGSAPCANHWYVGYVFGGGNNATYSQKTADYPEVNVQAGLVTHHVFGGGNGSGATVTGNPTVTLSGNAQVGGNVYGGGNAAAVDGNTSVKLQN